MTVLAWADMEEGDDNGAISVSEAVMGWQRIHADIEMIGGADGIIEGINAYGGGNGDDILSSEEIMAMMPDCD